MGGRSDTQLPCRKPLGQQQKGGQAGQDSAAIRWQGYTALARHFGSVEDLRARLLLTACLDGRKLNSYEPQPLTTSVPLRAVLSVAANHSQGTITLVRQSWSRCTEASPASADTAIFIPRSLMQHYWSPEVDCRGVAGMTVYHSFYLHGVNAMEWCVHACISMHLSASQRISVLVL